MLAFKSIPFNFLPLAESLVIPFCLLISGVLALLLSYSHILRILVAIEIILLACSLNFLIFSVYLLDPLGQLYSLLILVLAAAESVVGLTFLIVLFSTTGNTNLIGIISFRG